MKAAFAATVLTTSLMLGLTGPASAAGFQLTGVDNASHVLVTLKVGSLVDLQSLLDNAGFDAGNDMTSLEHSLAEIGLTFVYSGSWVDSPLIPGKTNAPGGVASLTETSASGNRFSVDFSYLAAPKLVDGTELVSFAISPPPGAWGKIELTRANLNPFTMDTGSLMGDREPLASLTVPIPEPSTYLMMALGLVVLGLLRRARC